MTDFYLSRSQVRELDRRAADGYGVPGVVLMENAGRGCADLLMRLNPDRRPTTVLCGPGNNGGDGFVIARHLDNAGWPVTVLAVEAPGPPSESIRVGWNFDGLPPDALTNYRTVRESRIDFWPLNREQLHAGIQKELTDRLIVNAGWVIDALFGTGLTRPLGPPYSELVALVNASPNPVLAIDIPSGLDCDTGDPLGPTVRATHTATFVAPKVGFRNPAAAAWTGAVHVVGIGAPRVLVESYRDGSPVGGP